MADPQPTIYIAYLDDLDVLRSYAVGPVETRADVQRDAYQGLLRYIEERAAVGHLLDASGDFRRVVFEQPDLYRPTASFRIERVLDDGRVRAVGYKRSARGAVGLAEALAHLSGLTYRVVDELAERSKADR